jgi:hypothetical protein
MDLAQMKERMKKKRNIAITKNAVVETIAILIS